MARAKVLPKKEAFLLENSSSYAKTHARAKEALLQIRGFDVVLTRAFSVSLLQGLLFRIKCGSRRDVTPVVHQKETNTPETHYRRVQRKRIRGKELFPRSLAFPSFPIIGLPFRSLGPVTHASRSSLSGPAHRRPYLCPSSESGGILFPRSVIAAPRASF